MARGPLHNTHSSPLPGAPCNPVPGETSLGGTGLPFPGAKEMVNTGTQEPPLSQVCLRAVPAQICCLLLPPCPTLDGGWCLPAAAHMELVNVGEAAVDELFGEVVPLHQEHVDLWGRAECTWPGSQTPAGFHLLAASSPCHPHDPQLHKGMLLNP